MKLTLYTLTNCDTCRKAVQWLRAHDVAFVEKPIRETPPTVAELRAMLAQQDGELRRLFNTAGQEFRALKLQEKLPDMREAEALALLADNGHLVKRPFLVGPEVELVGFNPTTWKNALACAVCEFANVRSPHLSA